MKIVLLPSSLSAGGNSQQQFLTSLLINETVAIDAGCLGFSSTLEEQARVRHILISHSHMDHVASMPIFLENVYKTSPRCVKIHGSSAVLESLRSDMFNFRLWPDFVALSPPEAPFLELALLEPGKPLRVEGLQITPIEVNHGVPTFGFLVEDDAAAVVIATDTGPTEEIWARAARCAHLKAVFLETTFSNNMADLAQVSGHLTPALFARELQKLPRPIPAYAVHIKARFRDQVVRELQDLGLPDLAIAEFGKPYVF